MTPILYSRGNLPPSSFSRRRTCGGPALAGLSHPPPVAGDPPFLRRGVTRGQAPPPPSGGRSPSLRRRPQRGGCQCGALDSCVSSEPSPNPASRATGESGPGRPRSLRGDSAVNLAGGNAARRWRTTGARGVSLALEDRESRGSSGLCIPGTSCPQSSRRRALRPSGALACPSRVLS